jgi:hypothetical protein
MNMAVAMTAYQRPDYLRRTMQSWAQVRGLRELVFERRVFAEPSPAQAQVAQEIREHSEWALTWNETRLGVLVNPVEAIAAMFRERPGLDFVVLAEDDVVVASDVLEYFAWAAAEFRADQSVSVVCAHRPQATLVEHPRDEAAVKYLGFSCPLVWGTWRDRWESFIEPTWDRDYRNRGWDWNLVMLMKAGGKHSIFPEQNRSDHIGEQGGAHCTPAMFPETVDPQFREDIPPCAYRLVEGPALW